EMGEHPQTVGYSLMDSPVGLAAWMLDHDPDSYKKISHAFVDGEPVGGLTRDRILDNMTLYWLTSTATSAARLYWEETQSIGAALASGQAPPKLSLPVGFTVFPSEIIQAVCNLHDVQEPTDLGRCACSVWALRVGREHCHSQPHVRIRSNKASHMHMFVRILGQPHVQRLDGRSQM